MYLQNQDYTACKPAGGVNISRALSTLQLELAVLAVVANTTRPTTARNHSNNQLNPHGISVRVYIVQTKLFAIRSTRRLNERTTLPPSCMYIHTHACRMQGNKHSLTRAVRPCLRPSRLSCKLVATPWRTHSLLTEVIRYPSH